MHGHQRSGSLPSNINPWLLYIYTLYYRYARGEVYGTFSEREDILQTDVIGYSISAACDSSQVAVLEHFNFTLPNRHYGWPECYIILSCWTSKGVMPYEWFVARIIIIISPQTFLRSNPLILNYETPEILWAPDIHYITPVSHCWTQTMLDTSHTNHQKGKLTTIIFMLWKCI